MQEAALEAPATPTATAVPLESLLTEEARGSRLAKRQFVSVLLLGTDSRPDEDSMSRSDSMILALLDLTSPSVVLISIPRDLWVFIPGYGESKINTAYFLGERRGRGAELAAETVSNLLNVPVNDTIVVDFHGFRALVDMIGGIEIDVPEPIDDRMYPDDYYGTFRLVIPAGKQTMDGERALQYARTRHGSSDILRAERQQAVLEAVRRTVLTPAHLPHLPAYVLEGASYISTSLSIPDFFFLARFGHSLPAERIHSHVIRSPLLWNGVTADGQQILLYDRYTLQQAVQEWLSEAAE
jgi:polyisoprenyl-teichoic acid--peptidoglycan teichoic acid transferase